MRPKFEKPQMVRGVVVVGSIYSGYVGLDNENCAIAKTLWYRHDDDLDELERDLRALQRLLMRSSKASGAIVSYEYRDYKG